jgi:inward rectifier potassium channel
MNYRTTFTKDGMTAARRIGINHLAISEIYNSLVSMSWLRFSAFVFLAYLSLTTFFTVIYSLTGFRDFKDLESNALAEKFWEVFLYNAQTLSTVGGAGVAPVGIHYNIILTVESMIAMLGMAIITGLLYVRFSTPTSGIVCSEQALVAPFRDGKALMFRLANAKKIELVELHISAFTVKNDLATNKRDVRPLGLERDYLPFLSHPLTIVHPLDDKSPLADFDWKDTDSFQYEIVLWVNGIDRATGQNVFFGRTYLIEDIVQNATFRSCAEVNAQGVFWIYLDKVGDYEQL